MEALEEKRHTHPDTFEERRDIFYLCYCCVVVHRRSDRKREVGSGGRGGAYAKHKKAAWRIRIRH